MERLSHGVLSDEAAAMLDGDRPVDVLVGIPSFHNARTIGHVVRALGSMDGVNVTIVPFRLGHRPLLRSVSPA